MPPRVRVDHTLSPAAAAIITRGAVAAGGTIVTAGSCDVLWSLAPSGAELRAADAGGRRISHIAGSDALTNKARLAEVVADARERAVRLDAPGGIAACPPTFAMPDAFGDLKLAAAYAPAARWVRRPRVNGTNQRREMVADVGTAGLDPRWVVQRWVEGTTAIRVPALVASLDPLIVECWDWPDAADVASAVRAAIELTITATVAAARDRMRDESAALEMAAGSGFELLEFEFLIDEAGALHLLECAKWPHLTPLERGGEHPRGGGDAVVAATLASLGMTRAEPAGSGGQFRRLLPSADLQNLALLARPTPADVIAARAAAAGAGRAAGRFQPQRVHHYFLDDAIVLFSEASERLSILNPTGSFVWLRTAEGAPPDVVAREAVDLFSGEAEAVTRDVWTTVAGWIADGMIARRDPPAMAPFEPLAHAAPRPRRRWNAGERVYEHLGRRICLRSPGGDTERWLQATLDSYEQPAAATYHDVVELLPAAGGFALLVNGTRTLGPFAPRDTPAAVHRQLRVLPLEAIGCVLTMRATLVETTAGAWLLLNAAADQDGRLRDALAAGGARVRSRERLMWCGDPLDIAEAGPPAAPLGVRGAILIERAVESTASALAPARRADTLRQLLAEDSDAIVIPTADAAARLVHFIQKMHCARLIVADAADAAACILRGT